MHCDAALSDTLALESTAIDKARQSRRDLIHATLGRGQRRKRTSDRLK